MISFVIPTLNAAKALPICLDAIAAQDFPRSEYEIVIADGGSTDATLEIARAHGVDRIVSNPLKTGEAGKAAGIAAAQGEFIALVDSDNLIDDPQWLHKMTLPFDDPEIVATEPIEYTARAEDPALTRYFALLGMNDPLCLFTGNYDRRCAITGRWTDLPVEAESGERRAESGERRSNQTIKQSNNQTIKQSNNSPIHYLKLNLKPDTLPTIGANGFVFRRTLLEGTNWTPYFFDIDILCEAMRHGPCKVAKVDCGIVHLYCARLCDFARKQRRRIRDYLFFAAEKQRSYPWDRQKKAGVVWFSLCTVLIIPLLIQMLRGALRRPDRAWWLHLPVCWITLWIYGCGALGKFFGIKPKLLSRATWQQVG